MPLNKEQFQQIQDALLDGYNEFNLRQMVRLRLDEALDRIAGGSNLEERVFNLIEWADRTGRERELVQEAYNHNPTNPALQKLHDAWFVVTSAAHPRVVSDVNPPQIFLSYSRRDSAQMQQVMRLLESAGFSVWTDEGLEPGTDRWQTAIENAIERTQCTVVLLSPDAKQSRWVSIEVSYAQELGRRVFPILLSGNKREAILFSLFDAQYLDGRKDLAEAVARNLLPSLQRYLDIVGTEPSTSLKLDVEVIPTLQIVPPQNAVIEVDWVTIPAGEFLIGSDKSRDKNAFDNELPQHRLHLPAYRITRTPVTVAQFEAFVKATGYKTTAEKEGSAYAWTGSKWEDIKGANWRNPRGPDSNVNEKAQHPVTSVSWHDARAYCAWLSQELGQKIRLPTEAEWEKAARGTDGRIYPWGNDAPDQKCCNFEMNVGDTTPVGKYASGASPYGCLDMAGNVWEWTSSGFTPYPYEGGDGREDLDSGARRVLRGGSFVSLRRHVRCAVRFNFVPVNRLYNGGFRVLSPGY